MKSNEVLDFLKAGTVNKGRVRYHQAMAQGRRSLASREDPLGPAQRALVKRLMDREAPVVKVVQHPSQGAMRAGYRRDTDEG